MLCAFGSRGLLCAQVDLPFASPTTVTGILRVPLLGPRSLLGSRLEAEGARVPHGKPADAPAPLFVTAAPVARKTEPVVREPAPAAEEAARFQEREQRR